MPSEHKDEIVPSGGFKTIFATGHVSSNDSAIAYVARSKRSRVWYTQTRPYDRTLSYDDLHTKLVDVRAFAQTESTRRGFTGPFKLYLTHSGYPWISNSAITYVESHPITNADDAKYRCLEQIGEAKWNLALFAAESAQTVNMIASTASTLAKAYKALRKGQFKKAARTLGIATPTPSARNSWLGYRYGWVPLLGDVASAAEAAASVLYKKPEMQHVLCRGSKSESSTMTRYSSSTSDYTFGSGLKSSARDVFKLTRTETKAWLTVRCKSRTFMRLEQFGLANPLALAWELVPFSFVADWFIGIGNYLNAQTALLGLEVVDGGYSTLSTRRLRSTALLPANTSQTVYGGSTPSYAVESRKYARRSWTGGVPTPKIEVNLNLNRIIDSAALIQAVFGKK